MPLPPQLIEGDPLLPIRHVSPLGGIGRAGTKEDEVVLLRAIALDLVIYRPSRGEPWGLETDEGFGLVVNWNEGKAMARIWRRSEW